MVILFLAATFEGKPLWVLLRPGPGFTYPEFVDELFILSGKIRVNILITNTWTRFTSIFWRRHGARLPSWPRRICRRHGRKNQRQRESIMKYLDKNKTIYDLTTEVFMHNSLHILKIISPKGDEGHCQFWQDRRFDTMNAANENH